jgi:hypothetical protein
MLEAYLSGVYASQGVHGSRGAALPLHQQRGHPEGHRGGLLRVLRQLLCTHPPTHPPTHPHIYSRPTECVIAEAKRVPLVSKWRLEITS